MIIYENDAASFVRSADNNQISRAVSERYREILGRNASEGEIRT